MESPKSRQHKEKKTSYRRREHKNKAFYNSKAWRDTREAYIKHYQWRLFTEIPEGKWGDIGLTLPQVSYLLSLDFLPCETCIRLYAADAYDSVEEGKELDHIIPVNRNNALDMGGYATVTGQTSNGLPIAEYEYSYGNPFSFNNLQLLCKRHHAKKSQRERQDN